VHHVSNETFNARQLNRHDSKPAEALDLWLQQRCPAGLGHRGPGMFLGSRTQSTLLSAAVIELLPLGAYTGYKAMRSMKKNCGGQRRRVRHLLRPAAGGGPPRWW